MGLIISEKKVTFGALRSVQNGATGGVVTQKKKGCLIGYRLLPLPGLLKRGELNLNPGIYLDLI